MCKSKEEGGLGFRDFLKFNHALLAKQVWRLLINPDSLLARVYKARYYPNGNLLDAHVGEKASYAWRSLVCGKDLLLKGLRKRISTGASTRVWTENWLFNGIPCPPVLPAGDVNLEMRVCDLFYPNSLCWNHGLLHQLFVPEDIRRILAIVPSPNGDDSYIWAFNTNGEFSVKSAYWLAMHDPEDPSYHAAASEPSLNPLFKDIWKIKAEPRIKIFLWKILNEAVPAAMNLVKRGMEVETQCRICGLMEETTCHILFGCPVARQVWILSAIPLPEDGFSNTALFSNVSHLLNLQKRRIWPSSGLKKFPWVLWEIWKSRNEVIFQQKVKTAQEILDGINLSFDKWELAHKLLGEEEDEQGSDPQIIKGIQWTPPRLHNLKCSFDFSWVQGAPFCGAAWLLRNHYGEAILHSRHAFANPESWLLAGVLAAKWTIEGLLDLNLSDIEVETDSRGVFEALTNPDRWPAVSHIINECPRIADLSQQRRLFLCKSTANKVAKSIARSVTAFDLVNSYLQRGSCSWFQPLLDADKPHGP